jgi:hypothetical protein
VNNRNFQIISMMPAVGWTAAICSVREGVPTVVDTPVVGLAVVRYAGKDSDVIEPCVRYKDVDLVLPATALREAIHENCHEGLAVAAPTEILDRKELIDSTRMWLRIDLRRYTKFEQQNGFNGREDRKAREDFAASGFDAVAEWASMEREMIEHHLYAPEKPAVPTPRTDASEIVVGLGEDATPQQIITAWKKSVESAGKNANEEFQKQFVNSADQNQKATKPTNAKQSRREKRLNYQQRRAQFEQYWAELVIADKVPSIGPRMSDEEKKYRAVLAAGVPVESEYSSEVAWMNASVLYSKASEYVGRRRMQFYKELKAALAAATVGLEKK